MNPFKIGGFVAAMLFVITLLGGSFYTVDEGERAVVKRYGEVVDVTGPGLHFKAPFISEVEFVSVQSFVRTYGTEGNMLQGYSKDMQVGDLIVSVNFTPAATPEAIRTIIVNYGTLSEYLRREVDPKMPGVVKANFAKYTAQSSNENQMVLATAILDSLQEVIPSTLVSISTAQVEDISFSKKFEDSMEARKMAETAVEIQIQENKTQAEVNKRTVNDAKAVADAVKAAADAEAYRTTQQSVADAEAIKRRGEAEADAISAKGKALASNPDLIDLTKAERWSGVLPTTMIPGSTVPFIDVK